MNQTKEREAIYNRNGMVITHDFAYYRGKIVARLLRGKAYKRRTSVIEELETQVKFFVRHGITDATVLPEVEFEALDDGNEKLAREMLK